MLLPLLTHLLQSQLCCYLIPIVQTINDTTRIFIFIQCHDIILNSNILSFTQYATDFNLALELCINKIEGEELILSVDGECQFSLRCFYVVVTFAQKEGCFWQSRWLVSWFDYYKCVLTRQIRRRGSNRIFFKLILTINCKYPSLRKLSPGHISL